jgi:Gpi18-like mannosyltransferase
MDAAGTRRKAIQTWAINRPFFAALGLFALLRIWFSLFGIVGVSVLPITAESKYPRSAMISEELKSTNFQRLFLNPWYRFDTVHYIEIAEMGYLENDHNAAFPPLLPVLIRLANFVIPSAMGSAMLVSNLAAFFSLWLLIVLIRENFSTELAKQAVFWLAVFPTTFVLFIPYTESLFLVLMLATMLTTKRKQWGLAALFAGLATLARFLGILLTILFVWEALRTILEQKKFVISKDWVVPLLAGLTPALFYLGHLGVLKYYFHAALPWEAISIVWNGEWMWPWVGFVATIQKLNIIPIQALKVGMVFDLISVIFVPVTLIVTRKKLPIDWQLFFWLLYIAIVSFTNNGAYISTFRHALPIIPIYLFLAETLVKKNARLAGMALCLPIQAGLLMMFYMSIFIF